MQRRGAPASRCIELHFGQMGAQTYNTVRKAAGMGSDVLGINRTYVTLYYRLYYTSMTNMSDGTNCSGNGSDPMTAPTTPNSVLPLCLHCLRAGEAEHRPRRPNPPISYDYCYLQWMVPWCACFVAVYVGLHARVRFSQWRLDRRLVVHAAFFPAGSACGGRQHAGRRSRKHFRARAQRRHRRRPHARPSNGTRHPDRDGNR